MTQIKIDISYTDQYGDTTVIGRILPDEADDAVRDLIGDYAADSSKNPSSWEDYTAGEFPRISVTEVEIYQRQLDNILSLERGAAYTADGSLNHLLMEYSARRSK